eukprot:scaffold6058_cov40-Tisochrysis_lutea.AAC.1
MHCPRASHECVHLSFALAHACPAQKANASHAGPRRIGRARARGGRANGEWAPPGPDQAARSRSWRPQCRDLLMNSVPLRDGGDGTQQLGCSGVGAVHF